MGKNTYVQTVSAVGICKAFRILRFRSLVGCIILGALSLGNGSGTVFAEEESTPQPPKTQSAQFPVDPYLRKRVDFWKKVYTQITSGEAYLHDKEDLSLIYRKITIKGMSRRSRLRKYRHEKREVQELLNSIASKNRQNLNEEEQKLNVMLGNRSSSDIRELSREIRMQIGMMDRYYRGLERSYQYMEEMQSIFRQHGLPIELVFLPHVESSFNEKAYSKVGAAGMWQFMRATARLYNLKLNYVIDERRDALASTSAAARFLKDNYARLKTWPLALTAYNHGPLSLERAIRDLGTRDISTIIQKYRGRRFGFASKNFYATFMATVEISKDPKKHFPGFVPPEKIPYTRLELPKPLTVNQLSSTLGVPKDVLRKLNRSIRPIAFRGRFFIPKGFSLKIPFVTETEVAGLTEKLKGVTAAPQTIAAGAEHIVSRGESLYVIARVYGVSMTDLIVLNEISNPTRVMPGMKLKIPGNSDKVEIAKRREERKKDVVAKKEVVVAKQVEPKPVEVAKVQADDSSEPTSTVESNAKIDLNDEKIETAARDQDQIAAPAEKKGFWSRVKSFFVSEKSPTAGETETVTDIVEVTKTGGILAPSGDEVEEERVTTIPFDDEFYNFATSWTNDKKLQVTVEVEETIGHLADWGGIRASDIRRANYMKFGEPIHVGQTLKLPITEEGLMDFNLKRLQYHQALEEDLYSNYKITGIKEYKIKRGDTVREITTSNEIPLWLLRKYQPSKIIQAQLQIGQVLKVPQLEPVGESVPPTTESEEAN